MNPDCKRKKKKKEGFKVPEIEFEDPVTYFRTTWLIEYRSDFTGLLKIVADFFKIASKFESKSLWVNKFLITGQDFRIVAPYLKTLFQARFICFLLEVLNSFCVGIDYTLLISWSLYDSAVISIELVKTLFVDKEYIFPDSRIV